MTTRDWRWRRELNAVSAVVFCALLVLFASGSRLYATPFASVIMDVRTGEILRSSNATARLHPASLTKMMTLYIAFEAVENGEISLDTPVRISCEAASQPPSRLGLRAGQTIAFRYLIRAAALRSANDAAVAIAEAIEGSVPNFAARMNRTARAIGMTRTTFHNPHGLTAEGHLSTATDMSVLGRQLYFDFPQYYNIFSRLSEDAGIATVRNTNRRFLNGYRGADGIKTGFTNAAGYNLTAMAERGGVRVLVTVMGARSSTHRYEQVVSLMNQGFRLAPNRVATRRPARPNYVHAPEDRGSGVSAGRVIRLQTAPTASLFPRTRPAQPGEVPSAEMIATLRDEIDSVIDDIRDPEPVQEVALAQETTEEPEEAAENAALDAALLASVALQSSPVPAPRPDAVIEGAADVARASTTSSSDATEISALVPPAARPETEPGTEATAAAAPAQMNSAPQQFDHTETAVAEIAVQDGMIVIPGLPPIAIEEDGAQAPEPQSAPETRAQPVLAQPSPTPADQLQPAEHTAILAPIPALEPAEGALSVGEDGRILWRDEELLTALAHEDPADPVLAPTIVLTTSAADEPVAPSPMPEIVTRVSTSGGRLWAVELGLYGSRFDAERVLLRLALSEAGTLGTGVRNVTPRNGRFAAVVQSLSRDEAMLACTRLVARNHPCSLIEP